MRYDNFMLFRTFKTSPAKATQAAKTGTLLLGAVLSFALTACFENNLANFGGVANSNNALSFSGSTFVISNVIITAPGSSSSSSNYTTNVFFNNTQSTTSISNECSTSTSTGSTSGCYCLFTWNQTLGGSQPIQRAVQTQVTNVQPNLVTCLAPQVYQNAIPDNTTIQVTVQAAPGNGASFQVNPYNYVKSSSTTGGSFQDAQGDSFQNILRYSCYEEYTRGMSIASQLFTSTNSQTGATSTYPRADALCLQKASASGAGAGANNCAGQLGATGYTSQANYYNLFIPQADVGDINLGNDRYKCPQVQESLAAGGQTATPGKNWPLDSQFALMVSPSASFSIGVEAFTAVSAGGDPVSAGSACFSGNSSTSGSGATYDNASLVKGCLGYAMPPNTSGTCPSFKNASNQIQFTYRLRRYVMMYPPIFDTDGTRLKQTQATDTVYVLDRPVSSPQSPTQPYTMKGPKPCPFAYYDNKGVAGPEDDLYSNSRTVIDSGGTRFYLPGYRATNNAAWNMTNIDGIAFPNIDNANSCSAAITVIGSGGANMSIATINNSNPAFKELYVRPVTPWAPHYEEDTDFQACAPESSTFQDPPLHFAKDPSGNVSWCAEVYPTQNPNVTLANGALDFLPPAATSYVGHVQNFTSHVVKNSASAQVAATIPPLPGALASPGYPSAGLARHPSTLVVGHSNTYNGTTTVTSNLFAPQTADRTVVTTSLDWTKFPLLAPSDDVEAAMRADPSYNCTVTYDNSGPKTGKTTPSGGCCGSVVFMKTGTGVTGPLDAHLEPDVTCAIPTY
jgi:hypothetical protein